MNRWEALTKIVVSFNKADRPWMALAAVVVFALPVLAIITAIVTLVK